MANFNSNPYLGKTSDRQDLIAATMRNQQGNPTGYQFQQQVSPEQLDWLNGNTMAYGMNAPFQSSYSPVPEVPVQADSALTSLNIAAPERNLHALYRQASSNDFNERGAIPGIALAPESIKDKALAAWARHRAKQNSIRIPQRGDEDFQTER